MNPSPVILVIRCRPSSGTLSKLFIILIFNALSLVNAEERIIYGKPLSDLQRAVSECSPRNEINKLGDYINNFSISVKTSMEANDSPLLRDNETSCRMRENTQALISNSVFSDTIKTNTNLVLVGCKDVAQYVIEDLNQAIRKGIKCLSDLGKNRQIDASRLAFLLDPKSSSQNFYVYCAHPKAMKHVTKWGYVSETTGTATQAEGLGCIFQEYPSIVLDYDYENIQSLIRQGLRTPTFNRQIGLNFHELLHVLGYMHTDNFAADVPFDSDGCCFMNDNDSCAALKNFKSNL